MNFNDYKINDQLIKLNSNDSITLNKNKLMIGVRVEK